MSMSGFNLFTPKAQGTTSIAATATTARVLLSKPAASMQIRIKNISTTDVVYVNFGDSTVVATIPSGSTGGSMPIGAGETAGVTVPEGITHVAAIASVAGPTTVFFTPGNGA
jgi:hypothetical protein